MRIALITNNYRPYSGGVVSSIERLYDYLIQQDHEVIIITFDFVKNIRDERSVERLPVLARFRYKENPMVIPAHPFAALSLILDEFKPNIIHVHHPFLLGTDGYLYAQQHTIPVVFTYHTNYCLYAHYVPLPTRLSALLINKKVLNFCKQVDSIIVPSASIADLLCPALEEKISVIPSGVSDQFFYQPHTYLHNPVQLLTVSRFVQEKNIPFLLHMMALLRDTNVHLTLVGYGAYLSTLQKIAFDILTLTNVSFVERPTKDELISYYCQADLFMFASESETQGLVIAEALASGLPVIAKDALGSCDSIVNGYNGFLVETTEQMAERVMEVINDNTLYQAMSRAAYESSLAFTLDRCGAEVVKVYQSLL